MYLSTSRYEDYTDTTKDALPVAIGTRKDTEDVNFTTYVTVAGDSFDRIANRVFSDPMRWWEIADINQHVPFPESIPVGTTLRIPRP